MRLRPAPLFKAAGNWYDLDTADQSIINVDGWNETRDDNTGTIYAYTFASPGNIIAKREKDNTPAKNINWYAWIHFDTPLVAGLMDFLLLTLNPYQDVNNLGAARAAHNFTLYAHLVTTDWTPAALKWSNQPGVAGDPNIERIIEVGADNAGGSYTGDWEVSFDLKAMYESGLAPTNIYGIRVAHESDSANSFAVSQLNFTAGSTPLRGLFPP